MAAHLRASSAQIGMADVMRLRATDIFRVEAILPFAAPSEQQTTNAHPAPTLNELAPALRDLSAQTDPAGVMDLLLSLIRDRFGYSHAMVLLNEADRAVVTTALSIGYGQSGVGAEVPHGVGLIGAAAASARSMRINDVSRVRRMGGAVAATSREDEVVSRRVTLPGLAEAMSQIAVPMSVQGQVRGVLFVESPDRLAFDNQAAAALEMIAQQAASALALNERLADEADEPIAAEPPPALDDRPTVRVLHHPFDHSVFIDHVYVIKGVAGQILMHMLDQHRQSGRADFSNRELRVSMGSTLPDFKDNLETRLLLLRRRLDELKLPVRLLHVGRGRLRLELHGEIVARST
jgi:adenylate cyclase